MANVRKVIIIGAGPAGYTAAIYAARANLAPVVFTGLQPGGQLTLTTLVENYPGFVDGVDGPVLMENFRRQAARFGTEMIDEAVTAVDFARRPFAVTAGDVTLEGHAVIAAAGASAKLLGLPAESRLMGRGVSTCATCDGAFYRKMEVAVIGGGDSAAEEALFLTRFASKVYLVHRRDSLRASKIMADRATSHPKIQPVWDSVPVAVEGVAAGAVSGLKVKNVKTNAETVLPVKGIFVAIGHVPNTAAFKHAADTDDQGYFVPTGHSQVKTKTPGLYVAGDCADHHYRQAITAAGMGCQAAIEAERWLADKEA